MKDRFPPSSDSKLHRLLPYLIVAGAVTILFLITMLRCDLYPFGDQSLANSDARDQYLNFYSYFRDLLFSNNDLDYSFSTILGAKHSGALRLLSGQPLVPAVRPVSRRTDPAGAASHHLPQAPAGRSVLLRLGGIPAQAKSVDAGMPLCLLRLYRIFRHILQSPVLAGRRCPAAAGSNGTGEAGARAQGADLYPQPGADPDLQLLHRVCSLPGLRFDVWASSPQYPGRASAIR